MSNYDDHEKKYLFDKYGFQLKKQGYFDTDNSERYKKQELDSIIKNNMIERTLAKKRSPIFQRSDPICQGFVTNQENEVNKVLNFLLKKKGF